MDTVSLVTAESPLTMATHTAEVNTSITQINTNFALLSYWEISTTYIVGKICYLSAYPYIQLECVVAGTSGSVEPSSFTVGSNLTDNTVTWRVRDTRNISPALSLNNVTITNTSTAITLASGALIGLRNSTGTRIINVLTSADITLTPTLAATTSYYLWLVHTASTNTTALLLTTSYTAPSYDYYRYLGGRFTDSSSRLYIIKQVGNECSYVVDGTILTGLRQITSGIAGNVVTPTYTPVQINMFVPNTAYKIKGVLTNSSGASSVTMLAPNDKYGTYASSTNPPPGAMYPNVSVYNLIFDFLLESMNIYYASDNANAHVWCFGWVDNL